MTCFMQEDENSQVGKNFRTHYTLILCNKACNNHAAENVQISVRLK
jgi:hypothetical protein